MSIDSIHQLIAWKPPYKGEPIIDKGILLPGTRLFLFGSPKTWKSMTSIHTVFSLATGIPWFGFRTRMVAVFKVQTELPKSVDRERVLKYQATCGTMPHNIFFKTPSDRYKLDTTNGYNKLVSDLKEVEHRIPNTHITIILDPLYKMFAGKITDEYDVKKFQDNMDMLLLDHDISLILIHHTRKSKGETDRDGNLLDLGAEEAIGSSYWGNWCDTMIRLKLLNPYAGKNEIEFSFEYTRNSQEFLSNFKVRWSRSTLHPTVYEHDPTYEPEIYGDVASIRNLDIE